MRVKDWKELLSEEDRKELKELLDKTRRHRCAYLEADDTKIAQLWCALIELRKEMKEFKKLIEKVSEPFKAIVEIGEAEKRRAIERVITGIIKPTEEQEKAVKKLVDSLMKF